MNSIWLMLRGSGAPPARLDHARFGIIAGLNVGELMPALAIGLLLPLFAWGVKLPEGIHFATMAGFWVWVWLLFFIRHEDHHVLYWLGRMIPFWLRQRIFRARPTSGFRVTPESEQLDRLTLGGENSLSFDWRTGRDGEPELHIFEAPLRPYRAWVAASGRPTGRSGKLREALS